MSLLGRAPGMPGADAPASGEEPVRRLRLQVAFLRDPIPLARLTPELHRAGGALGLRPGEDYELLVSPLEIGFALLRDLRTQPLPEAVEQGVLFGPGGQIELREIDTDWFRAVAWRAEPALALDGSWDQREVDVVVHRDEPQAFPLWGRRADDGRPLWQEGRIQRAQAYPWPGPGQPPRHVALAVTVYRDPATAEPLYVHWRGLVPDHSTPRVR